MRFPLTLTLVATSPLFAQPELHPGEFKMKPQIDAAIGRGVEFLLNGQLRDGSFGIGNYPVGRTGLRVYALLKSGVRTDHPVMRRALAYLKGARTNKTYSLAWRVGAAIDDAEEPAQERPLVAPLEPVEVAVGRQVGLLEHVPTVDGPSRTSNHLHPLAVWRDSRWRLRLA